MFVTQRQNTESVRRMLATAGFIYNGEKYVYTKDPNAIKTYLETSDLGAPRQTRRRRASEVGFFCTTLMMFALVGVLGNFQMLVGQ